MAEIAKRLGKFMKEKSYEPGECLTEVARQPSKESGAWLYKLKCSGCQRMSLETVSTACITQRLQ